MLTEAGRDRADWTALPLEPLAQTPDGDSGVGAAVDGCLLDGATPKHQKEACSLAMAGHPSKERFLWFCFAL